MLRQCERDRERERAKAVHKTRRGRGEWEGKGIKAGEAVEDLELCLAAVRAGALTTTATVRNRLRNPEREREEAKGGHVARGRRRLVAVCDGRSEVSAVQVGGSAVGHAQWLGL